MGRRRRKNHHPIYIGPVSYTHLDVYKRQPTDRPWYQAAVASDGVARLVYEDAANGEWLFSQSKKLVDDEGNVVGAVSVDCSNELISRQLSTRYQYASQRSFITDLSGKVLIHPEDVYKRQALRA